MAKSAQSRGRDLRLGLSHLAALRNFAHPWRGKSKRKAHGKVQGGGKQNLEVDGSHEPEQSNLGVAACACR